MDHNPSLAIQCGQIQCLAEATLSGKGLTEAEFRSWLLPICAREGLSADSFEWLSRTLCKRLGIAQANEA